ncbi:hypothetical protein B566_EDAN017135 [Ephemera danica]|nr:hypothetical protein B566_EDAN017135 [Ephemera danica]
MQPYGVKRLSGAAASRAYVFTELQDSPVQTTRKCNCSPNNCEAADKYYQQLEEVFKYSLPRGRVAGFFAESIQGVGGTVQFPKGYLQKAFEIVQTGFGRTGETYWGFESHGVVPDIVTMAKGIGNGFPLAAVVTTPKIAEALGQALHFNTYGGNPIACAVGLEVLKVIEDEGTQVNSHKVGTQLLKRLAALRDQFPNVVGDVRGKGLMIGVELVAEPENRTPLPAPQFLEIWEECKDQGVLRIKPPMIITKTDADFAADVLSIALARHCDTIAKAAKKSNGRT